MASPYETVIACVDELTDDTVRSMADLYLQHYDGSSDALFRQDLAEKDQAILLYSAQQLVGFTTLKVFQHAWQQGPIRIVYSGDTIVSPAHWGQQKLAFAWIAQIGRIKRQAPHLPLYWFLLVKGHRTFKYLAVFGKSFFPHWAQDRSDLQPLAEQLAREKFGALYNAGTGIVEFPQSRGHLCDALAQASAEELGKPATRFFLARNPGYRCGHELVCLCELELSNMMPLTARIFGHALADPVGT